MIDLVNYPAFWGLCDGALVTAYSAKAGKRTAEPLKRPSSPEQRGGFCHSP